MNNEERNEKIRIAHLKRFYGDDFTMEEVEQHRREKNTEYLGRWRDKHREHFSEYQREYQRQYRERNKYYYGWKHALDKNPDLTLEEYIKYRENKLKKKMAKSIKSKK